MPPLHFTGASSWVHSVDPSLNILAPGDGSFVPGVEETVPGNPSSQQKQKMVANEDSGAARHTVIPATPLPSIPGDINMDRYVNFIDVAILTGNWLECNAPDDPNCTWVP